ncbi:casein kinase substrate phosphoprotein PP28-domain-containing protein [Dissophora ornata]|nr:casein kinase substrate phosphoprotein PP28-domain-containing protein [Dissophora ornata]
MAGGKFKKPQRGGGRTFSRRIQAVHTSRPETDREELEEDDEPSVESEPANAESEESETDSAQGEATAAKNSGTSIPGIEVHNPNHETAAIRRQKGTNNALDMSIPIEMSRKEREAAEKEAAKQRYWKLHKEGKTVEAKADMARLAVVRKEREEAAAQRLANTKAKEEAAAAKLGLQGSFEF